MAGIAQRARGDARLTAGALALAAIALMIGGAFAGLVAEALRNPDGAAAAFDPYLLRVIRFTLWQAALSTVLSVLPAMLVARALMRHPAFPGRRAILALFGLPLGLPAIVAVLGMLALYGRNGYFAGFLSAAGGDWPGIYGLSGILLAHVFFNLPLATRLLLEALATIPADQWRLAAQLGMPPAATFRLIEWPVLRAALPGTAMLVFMLCITSFTIVLTLGGGPAATTLEVAIYQALRFDFAPSAAVTLTLVQLGLTAAVAFAAWKLGGSVTPDATPSVVRRGAMRPGRAETIANGIFIALALALVAGPMVAVVVSGLSADLGRLATDPAVQRATLVSLALSLCSALLAVMLATALVMAQSAARGRRGAAVLLGRVADATALVLVVPPIVIGAGWFVLLYGRVDVLAVAPVMVATVNAVMAMPFAVRAIRPAYDAAAASQDRLCRSLGVAGWNRLRLVDWPAIRRPAMTGAAFAAALSLGDLGVIALFGSDAVATLPYLLYGRLGSYRTSDAAGLALFLAVLCMVLILIADRLGRSEKP